MGLFAHFMHDALARENSGDKNRLQLALTRYFRACPVDS